MPQRALLSAPMDTNSGKQLQLTRIAMDLSATQVACAAGVPVSTISRWENSRRPVTSAAQAKYIAALATFGTIPTVTVSEVG